MQPTSFYAVYDDNTPNGSPRMWNYSQGLYLALENVRVVRNQIINPYAGDTFAVDRILPTDPASLSATVSASFAATRATIGAIDSPRVAGT